MWGTTKCSRGISVEKRRREIDFVFSRASTPLQRSLSHAQQCPRVHIGIEARFLQALFFVRMRWIGFARCCCCKKTLALNP